MLNFGKPAFSNFHYANHIIEERAYLILSWEMKNAHQLKIKNSHYTSLLKSGSAYVAIKNDVRLLELVTSGTWRSTTYSLPIYPIKFIDAIAYSVTLITQFEANVIIPDPILTNPNLKISNFKVFSVRVPKLKNITNISYPNY